MKTQVQNMSFIVYLSVNKLLSPLLFSLLIYSDNHSNYSSEFLQLSLLSFAVKNGNNKNNNN